MKFVKNFIKHLFYFIIDLFIPEREGKMREKSLAILRLDAIGDYILFRNFIEVIAKSDKYRGYSITLIGNEAWKSIAELYDVEFIDQFLWVNPTKFRKNFSYRKKLYEKLQANRFSVFFNPVFSTEYYIIEKIANRIRANEKVSVEGNLSNITKWQKRISHHKYDYIIGTSSEAIFEFERNKEICSEFLGENIELQKPIMNASDLKVLDNNEPYIVLFIGGSVEFKRWSIASWEILINKILKGYSYSLVIAGGPSDKEMGENLKSIFRDEKRVRNLAGSTSLPELISLISNADVMISNETSAPHMAVALKTPVLVIGNAKHYGRFSPYPEKITKKYKLLLPPIAEKEKDTLILIQRYGELSDLDIQEIKPELVAETLKDLMNEN